MVRPLFRKEEEYARAAASSWIAHPVVRGALDAVRPNALAVTAILLPYMTDQIQCMRFCWRVCGIGPVYPDGSEEPNPFDPEGLAPWPLTECEREEAGYIAAAFHCLVLTVAAELCNAGVPLDPGWAGDQAVLAVLLLLPALGYQIPWDGKIDKFASVIQPPGVSASIGMAGQPPHATAGRMPWPATRTASVSTSGLRTAAVTCTCLTLRGQGGRYRAPP
jgi:hypothetical protein